jgi:hypothetical protein
MGGAVQMIVALELGYVGSSHFVRDYPANRLPRRERGDDLLEPGSARSGSQKGCSFRMA